MEDITDKTIKVYAGFLEYADHFNGAAAIETPEFMAARLDDFGGPDSYNHYAVGWAHARLGKGGNVVLFVDGENVGEGRVGATAAMIFSADDTCDVGMEGGAVVSEDYGPGGNEFTGEVNWVKIDLDAAAEDLDHLITPEERLQLAMARQ
jgi:hypothetical protein